MNAIGSWILVAWSVCAAVCAIHLIVRLDKWLTSDYKPALLSPLSRVLYALTLPVLAAPLYYEFSGAYNTAVTFENNRAVIRPLGAFVLEWSGKFANVPTSLPINVYGEVRTITPNPKVRELSYELKVGIADLDKFFADPSNRSLGMGGHSYSPYGTSFSQFPPGFKPQNIADRIGTATLYLLYDFNNAHSKELAEFYNPLDPKQVSALKALVEPWVNERLAPAGLRAQLQSFTVK